MLRGAIVGLGNVALEGHLPAWKDRKDFQIAAGVDSSKERISIFKKSVPGAVTFESFDECLVRNGRDRSLLDFVDIATPPHTHFALAKAALSAGLHVLCEKPLVLKPQEIFELDALRKKSGKILMTVHNWKFAPICRKISHLVREGAVGRVKRLDWYVLRSGPSVTTEKENWRLKLPMPLWKPFLNLNPVLLNHGAERAWKKSSLK